MGGKRKASRARNMSLEHIFFDVFFFFLFLRGEGWIWSSLLFYFSAGGPKVFVVDCCLADVSVARSISVRVGWLGWHSGLSPIAESLYDDYIVKYIDQVP